MSKKEYLTTVVVDTNAFIAANSDFLGISSALLPSFFSVIKEKNLKLLIHPILEMETEKHIEDSSLYRNFQNLKRDIKLCESALELAGYNDEELVSKIQDFDIKQLLFQSFKDNYADSCVLGYANPEKVFEDYFACKPPFSSTGNKKVEFPDAFVIESIEDYIDNHTNDVLLIVTNDKDWESAFEGDDNVELCKTIDEAVKRINNIKCILDSDMLDTIFNSAYDAMIKEADSAVQCECYELKNYETINDIYITNIEVESINNVFTPLNIRRDSVLLRTEVQLKMSGEAEIFDEDNSIWCSEDRDYITKEYADIKFEGSAEVECEIEIDFDFDNLDFVSLRSFKLINNGNIEIDCDNIGLKLVDEYEMAIRCLREEKGLPRK